MRNTVAGGRVEPLVELPALDRVLEAHAAELGGDFDGYRNHAYRVANLCIVQGFATPLEVEKIAIAAAFHDLAIWTDRTFDYLEPSVRLAGDYLAGVDRGEWRGEIAAMIREHHKLLRCDGALGRLVEPFRRADWIDVSKGVLAFGVPRPVIRTIMAAWPNAGFHRRLVHLQLRRLRTHPWHPLPMVRL
jgi:hypothetical protein